MHFETICAPAMRRKDWTCWSRYVFVVTRGQRVGLLTVTLFACATPSAGPASSVDAPPLAIEPLPSGPLPGETVRGRFRVPGIGVKSEAHRLVSTGQGYRRTSLLIARGASGQLCVAAVTGGRRRAGFRCLARWDHAPMLALVGAGGRTRDRTTWVTAVGLVRVGVVHDVTPQRFDAAPAQLRSWQGFPWAAFATTGTRRRSFPDELRAHNAVGVTVQRIWTSWAWDSPCPDYSEIVPVPRPKTKPGCGPRAKGRHWSVVRDPVASQQYAAINGSYGTRAKRLAFADTTVLRFVAGQPFAIDATALWTKCNQQRLGAVVEVALTQPISFEADLPVTSYSHKTHTAYREGVAHVRVRDMSFFWVKVDLNRRRVVAITPEPDLYESGQPQLYIDEFRLITPLRPAGGRDSGNCETKD
jgi:hypothetical protein